jgi:hypothetical protein
LQAGYYHELPDTLSQVKAAAQSMDLSHQQYAPTPRSISWWAGTLLLLSLGLWQRVLKSSMQLGFWGLELISPAAAEKLTELQQQHQPPWKRVGGVPDGSASKAKSEAAREGQRSSIQGSAGKGLVGAAAAVNRVVGELAPAMA